MPHKTYQGAWGKEGKSMSAPDRLIIAQLSRASKAGLISISSAARALETTPLKTAIKLSSLARRGWLLRARRGLYFILPLEAEPGKATISEDPWILAHEVFFPCYIAGWSAAEYWGLTEQLFRPTLVITAAHVRKKTETILGHEFRLFRVPIDRISGTKMIWRGRERIAVSTPERTLIDCLQYPELCGGIRHLVQMMNEYGKSDKRNISALIASVKQIDGGAIWKRLGYLSELLWPEEKTLLQEAKSHLSKGYAKLDPDIREKGKLLRRWRIWVNVAIKDESL